MLSLKSTTGVPQSVEQWVKEMQPSDRAALHAALAPYMEAASTGPVSLERFKRDFSALDEASRKSFMGMIQDARALAEKGIADDEVNAAWDKTIADAKARQAQARAEVAQ
jgi:hypothetical protein